MVQESEDSYSGYTLLRHNYSDNAAILWRNDPLSEKSEFGPQYTYVGDNKYQESTLDQYINTVWFPTQLASTRELLTPLTYLVAESASTSSDQTEIQRDAATLSMDEIYTVSTSDDMYGTLIDWSFSATPLWQKGVAYWTRQPIPNTSNVFSIGAGNQRYSSEPTSVKSVYPTIGVPESGTVKMNDALGAYVLSKAFTPPEHLYLNGYETDISDAHPERVFRLSWDAADGDIENYYIFQNNITETGGGRSYYTTSTSAIVYSPPHGYTTSRVYLRVLPKGETEYILCGTRTISTRNSNIQYCDDNGVWYLAKPKYFNGSYWNDSPNAMYYYGEDTRHLLYGSEELEDSAFYSVDQDADGAQYPFKLDSDGWYVSTNAGHGSTCSLCKVQVHAVDGTRLTVTAISDGEINFDYGMLSILNPSVPFTDNSTVENSAYLQNGETFKDKKGQEITVDYGVLSAGDYYFYAKYIKDGSLNTDPDTFKFKVELT